MEDILYLRHCSTRPFPYKDALKYYTIVSLYGIRFDITLLEHGFPRRVLRQGHCIISKSFPTTSFFFFFITGISVE